MAISDRDALLTALLRLKAMLEGIEGELRRLNGVCDRHMQQRADGAAWHAIVEDGGHPLLVGLLNEIAAELADVNSRYRRAVAQALRDEGLTMTSIAGILRVTRQRVATLLAARDS